MIPGYEKTGEDPSDPLRFYIKKGTFVLFIRHGVLMIRAF